MAEYVERKFTAAKLSVALAVAALLGGLAARDSSAGAATPVKAAEPDLGAGSITTAEVKDHSLLFKDMKVGEIFSKAQAERTFLKLSTAKEKYLKIAEAVDAFVKVEDLAGAVDAFVKAELAGAVDAFLKIDDANKTFVKIEDAQHQFVNGDGRVRTGFEQSTGGAAVPVLDVPGMVLTEGLPAVQAGPRARLTNEGATPLHYAIGGGGGTGVIAPGKTQEILISGQGGGSVTVQLISEGSPPAVGTLTVSSIPAGGTTNFSAQILIGDGL